MLILILGLVTLGMPSPLTSQELAAPAADAPRRVLGYYVPYDPASWFSLEAHASSLDMVAVQWVSMDACGGLTSHDDRTLHQFARAAGLQVFPSLLTLSGELNHRLL